MGYEGELDEIAFWNSDKTSDLANIFNSGNPNDLSTLSVVNWYRFEEGSGTTATDSGSGANDGTLTNGPSYSTDTP